MHFKSACLLFSTALAALPGAAFAQNSVPPAPTSPTNSPATPPSGESSLPPPAVVSVGSGAVTTSLDRGRVALGRHDWATAAQEFDTASRENPNDADALTYYGFAVLMQLKFDDAITAFQGALKLQPDNTTALSNLGTALLSKPNASPAEYRLASETFLHLLRLKPGLPTAQSGLGTAALRSGNWEQAVISYRSLLDNSARDTDGDAPIYASLGFALSRNNQPEDAIAALDKSIALKPEQQSTQALLGALHLERGESESAIRSLEAARTLAPDNYGVLLNLGRAYMMQKRYSDAATVYTAAAQQAEKTGNVADRIAALNGEGTAQQLLGDDRAALDTYNAIIGLDSSQYLAQLNSGLALYKLGQEDAAATRFKRAIALRPNSALAWQGYAKTLEQKKEWNDAFIAWGKAAQFTSDPIERYQFSEIQAAHLLRTRQWAKLSATANRMQRLQPNAAAPHALLGLSYQIRAEQEPRATRKQLLMVDALSELQTAARLAPDNAVVQNNIGVLHERRGEIPEAITAYRKALAIDPGMVEARQNLGRYGQNGGRQPHKAKMGTLLKS